MQLWGRLTVFTVLLSRHNQKQVSEVCSHIYWTFPQSHWSRAAVLCHGVITEPGNILSHYTSVSLWAPHKGMTWLPAPVGPCDEMLSYRMCVRQRALELSGPYSHTHCMCVCVHMRLAARYRLKVSTSWLFKSHCAAPLCRCLHTGRTGPPWHFPKNKLYYFNTRSWCLVNTKQ